MPKSTYTANNTINFWYRNTPQTPPAAVYVALFTVMPGVGGGGTEVSGGNYIRQAVTIGAPSGGIASNSVEVIFPTATADWGTLVGYAYFDAVTSGNMISFSPLGAPRTILTGDVARFPAGMLTITET